MQMNRNPIFMALPLALAAVMLPSAQAQSGGPRFFRVIFNPIHHSSVAVAAPHGFSDAMGSQGYLGIGFHDVSDDRVGPLKLKDTRGAEIMHVDHDGPAGKAGLREHDVILQVNGEAIEGEEQLHRILHEIPSGHNVTIVLSRDGQQQTVTTQMLDRSTVERQAWEQRTTVPEPGSFAPRGNGFMGGGPIVMPPITAPPDPAPHSFIGGVMLGSSYTGAALEAIGPQLAQFFGSQGGNGLLVRSVEPNSPAASAGLRAGDVVVRANAVIIAGIGDWFRIVKENKNRQLTVVVVRDKQEQTILLVPDSKKRSSNEPGFAPFPGGMQSEQAEARCRPFDLN